MAIIATIARTTRQGVFILPSAVVPAGLAEILLKLNVSNATYNATGKSVLLRFYVLDETQGLWRLSSTSRWDSGPYTDPETGIVNPPPVLSPGIAGLAGRTVRAEIDVPVSMSVGATVETLP